MSNGRAARRNGAGKENVDALSEAVDALSLLTPSREKKVASLVLILQ